VKNGKVNVDVFFPLVPVQHCVNVCKPQNSGLRPSMSLLVIFHDWFWHSSTQEMAASQVLTLSCFLCFCRLFYTSSEYPVTKLHYIPQKFTISNVCDSFTDTQHKQLDWTLAVWRWTI